MAPKFESGRVLNLMASLSNMRPRLRPLVWRLAIDFSLRGARSHGNSETGHWRGFQSWRPTARALGRSAKPPVTVFPERLQGRLSINEIYISSGLYSQRRDSEQKRADHG